MLITFEGIDNMGKTTVMKELSKAHFTGLYTKEPGSPSVTLNTQLREMVLTNKSLTAFERELLFYVDASQHRRWIKAQVNSRVISDRGLLSHLAYLYGTLKTGQMDYEQYGLCKRIIKESCAIPDAIIYFDGDLDLMKYRQLGEGDLIESSGMEFYSYVLTQYEDLIIAAQVEKTPVLVLDPRASIQTNVNKSCEFIQQLTV